MLPLGREEGKYEAVGYRGFSHICNNSYRQEEEKNSRNEYVKMLHYFLVVGVWMFAVFSVLYSMFKYIQRKMF